MKTKEINWGILGTARICDAIIPCIKSLKYNLYGVATRKKINPITIGAIKFPRKIPNLNHNLFKGESILESSKPKTRKTIDIIKDQILSSSPLRIGQIEINKNTTKKTIPKLLFDDVFMFINL